MPQLDPSPWFPVLLLTWIIFITIPPLKLMKYNHINEPTHMNPTSPKTWTWPWH
uniref:ATP synthase complex subunit 8 n=1 Tax=Electrophorus electricus TaxID=8005 RepID=F7UI93_ELEEL|nr:ATPase subunit 8 [Electrophorus electricus]QZL29554.1 ATPase subunit 8 [Electrophorus electricus]BAK41957.1 ATPase subunit 8 [Electrophorus electricus]